MSTEAYERGKAGTSARERKWKWSHFLVPLTLIGTSATLLEFMGFQWRLVADGIGIVMSGNHHDERPMDPLSPLRTWAWRNLGDSAAEVTGLGAVRQYEGRRFRVFKMRTKKGSDPHTFATYFAEVNQSGDVLNAWNSDDFTAMAVARYGEKKASELLELVTNR